MSYVLTMVIIILLSISLMAVGTQWKVVMKREQEAELIFRANRIKVALEKFGADYEVKKTERDHRYPVSLAELTELPNPYLPRIYKDPITRQDFELIKTTSGARLKPEIIGVRSRSHEKPMNQTMFGEKAQHYRDIIFAVSEAECEGAPELSSRPLPGSYGGVFPQGSAQKEHIQIAGEDAEKCKSSSARKSEEKDKKAYFPDETVGKSASAR